MPRLVAPSRDTVEPPPHDATDPERHEMSKMIGIRECALNGPICIAIGVLVCPEKKSIADKSLRQPNESHANRNAGDATQNFADVFE